MRFPSIREQQSRDAEGCVVCGRTSLNLGVGLFRCPSCGVVFCPAHATYDPGAMGFVFGKGRRCPACDTPVKLGS